MSQTSELRAALKQTRLELARDTLDLIEEHIAKIKITGTPSGHELIYSSAHKYLDKKAAQQRAIIERLELS